MTNVLSLDHVSVVRSGNRILNDINWQIDSADRWIVVGPNGSGKTTLMNVAAATMYPTEGTVKVLDKTLGQVDVFGLRPRIGIASSSMAARFPAGESVRDVVMTAAYAVTGRWNEKYESIDIRRADRVLAEWGLASFADREYGSLSDGEKKRVQIARAVMTDPEILLLDEPTANLDLGAREEMVALLTSYAESDVCPAMVMVTHHVEDIPEGFTHALVLSVGEIVRSGPLDAVINNVTFSEAYGMPLVVNQIDGRYSARAVK